VEDRHNLQFEKSCFKEMCRCSEADSYLGLIDFVYHSALGLRVIKKSKRGWGLWRPWTLDPGPCTLNPQP